MSNKFLELLALRVVDFWEKKSRFIEYIFIIAGMVKVSYDIHGNLKFWEILHISINCILVDWKVIELTPWPAFQEVGEKSKCIRTYGDKEYLSIRKTSDSQKLLEDTPWCAFILALQNKQLLKPFIESHNIIHNKLKFFFCFFESHLQDFIGTQTCLVNNM
jgi:hypothetical protein